VSGPSRTLILVLGPLIERAEFELLAGYVREIAPDIHAAVVDDRVMAPEDMPSEFDLPTMVFSPALVRGFQPRRGRVFQGLPLTKSQEYLALDRLGVAVPLWTQVTPTAMGDLGPFGSYVVFKPDAGMKGAAVRIMRKDRVRWRPVVADISQAFDPTNQTWIVQDFVYTGPWPVSYRVTTLFGETLFAVRIEADRARRPLEHRRDFAGKHERAGVSIVSAGRGCVMSMSDDPEVLALACRAHAAFPGVPLLGVDVLRDADTGRLYVCEVNAIGLVWHFASEPGRRAQREFGLDFDAQFDGRRKAARILVEQVRRHAT
jgi:hypothetical protein